jgi:hypothetical protein
MGVAEGGVILLFVFVIVLVTATWGNHPEGGARA